MCDFYSQGMMLTVVVVRSTVHRIVYGNPVYPIPNRGIAGEVAATASFLGRSEVERVCGEGRGKSRSFWTLISRGKEAEGASCSDVVETVTKSNLRIRSD